ncbi:MAG: caspase family protein [Betaproteobacteria bacterium]|nr:caspase family protein [Betaproteobacteria bacterium]
MKKILVAAAAAAALASPFAQADTHALIMTIGQYGEGVPPLAGVQYDGESARAIAKRMGVKDQNMREYKDGELTLEGMRKAFDDLYARVGENDQVFIYYSGHGSRQIVHDPEERCAESLVTVDRQGFTDADMEKELQRLAKKAQKLVVFLDACHSGGVTTRAIGGPFSPKFYARSGGDSCSTPTNVITRKIQAQTRSLTRGVNNYVYIAAARDSEVSLDQPGKGGVATQAWRDCIAGAARDSDGSGGLSAEEIAACAQARIDKTLANVKGFSAHHVSITGNKDAVLAFAARDTDPAPAPAPATEPAATPVAATPVAAAPVAAAPAPAPATPTPPPAPAKPAKPAMPAAYYTLQDIYANRDDRRLVTLQAAKSSFKIGADAVEFTLMSSHPGYVYLLMVGSDGKSFDMLFPNTIDQNNAIQAGQPLKLPRPSWEIKAGGPAGKDHLLAVVADSPRDFSKVGMQPAGPFSMVAASAASSKDIQLVTTTSAAAETTQCAEPPARRSLVIQQRCSNAYGAAMMAIEETN